MSVYYYDRAIQTLHDDAWIAQSVKRSRGRVRLHAGVFVFMACCLFWIGLYMLVR